MKNDARRNSGDGFVYVAATEAHPGLVKIGFTRQEPRKCVRQFSTGSPHAFEILHVFETNDPRWLERTLHTHFAVRRVNAGREFFRVTLEEILKAARQISEEQRYKEDLDKARKRIEAATIWWIRGKKSVPKAITLGSLSVSRDRVQAVIALCVMAIPSSIINAWVVSNFDWVKVLEVPFWAFIYLTALPFGWLVQFGAIFLTTWIIRKVDRPRNLDDLEVLRLRLARDLRLDSADLKI
jgi:hypothetical protein